MIRDKIKYIVFIFISLLIGTIFAFLLAELGYRFYLFGPKLHFQDTRAINRSLYSEDKRYVFFTGDSFTAGYPFPIDFSYPLLLQKTLKTKGLEVHNFAVARSTLYDQVNIIRQTSDLKPSLIIWGLSTNDTIITQDEKKDLQKLGDYKLSNFSAKKEKPCYLKYIAFDLPHDCLFRAKMGVFSTIKEVLNTCSYVYVLLKQRLGDVENLKFLKARYNANCELREMENTDQMEFYKKGINGEYYFGPVFDAILNIKNMLRDKKIDFIVLFVPQEMNLNEDLFQRNIRQFGMNARDYNRSNPRDFIRKFCLNNDIVFIDPSDYMEKELRAGKSIFMKFDRHYNRNGNNAMAKFLSENETLLSKFNSYTQH